MFLELHLEENDNKILLNIERILSIYQAKGATYVIVSETFVYRVKESYEDIAKCLDKYYEYRK